MILTFIYILKQKLEMMGITLNLKEEFQQKIIWNFILKKTMKENQFQN